MSRDYGVVLGWSNVSAAIFDRQTGTVYANETGSGAGLAGPALTINGQGVSLGGAAGSIVRVGSDIWIFVQKGTASLFLTKLTITPPAGSSIYPGFPTQNVTLTLAGFVTHSASAVDSNIIFAAGNSVYKFSPATGTAAALFTSPDGLGITLTNVSNYRVIANTGAHLYLLNASTLALLGTFAPATFGFSSFGSSALDPVSANTAWTIAGANDIYTLDLSALTKTRITVSGAFTFYTMWMNAAARKLVLLDGGVNTIYTVDISSLAVSSATLPGGAQGTARNDDAGFIWSGHNSSGDVWQIDPSSLAVAQTVNFGVVGGFVLNVQEFSFVSFLGDPIGHGVNCNDYAAIGSSQGSTTPPGNGALIKDLEPMRNWCRANGISAALNQDSQRSAKDLLDELFTVGNSAPVYSGDKLKVIPYDEVSAAGNGAVYIAPTAAGPVFDLTDKDFVDEGKKPPVSFTRKRRADCDNVVAIEFIDRSLDYARNAVSELDQKAVAQYGPRKGGTLATAELGVNMPSGSKSLRSIYSSSVAQAVASILAKRGSAGVNEFSFGLKAEWMHLEAMDLVTITDTRLGLSKVPVRLKSVKETPKRTLDCVAERFVYGLNHPSLQDITAAAGTLVQADQDPGLVNAPIIFQPTPTMLGTGGAPELWFLVSGADPNYGGCVAYVSIDGGVTYPTLLGNIPKATTGVLTADYADHADPDTTDTLAVNLTESGGALSTQPMVVADNFADPCYLGGSDVYHWEVVCYTTVTLTSAEHYSLSAYIRRACLGTAHADHPIAKRFAAIDGALFRVPLPEAWVGATLYFKFAAYNLLNRQQNQLSACVPYTYTPLAIYLPGGFYVNGS